MSGTRSGSGLLLSLLFVFLMGVLGNVRSAHGHEVRPAVLEIKEIGSGRYDVLWRTPLFSGQPLPVVLQFPDDVRSVSDPRVQNLSDSIIERRVIETASGALTGRRVQFVGLQATITDVLVRVRMLDGSDVTTFVHPLQPWFDLAARQSWDAVAGSYVIHGIEHILFGLDHLLFVLGLLLIVKDRWMLLKTITAFTAAHSLTLSIATLGFASAPVALLNALIALSILFLAPEIVRSWRAETSFTIRHPWVVAFAFGLIHGFGFASALTSAGLPRQDLPLALLSFNVGVEIGQVAFVLLIVLLERSFQQLEIRWPRWVKALPGYAVGSLGALWTIDRTAALLGIIP